MSEEGSGSDRMSSAREALWAPGNGESIEGSGGWISGEPWDLNGVEPTSYREVADCLAFTLPL